MRPELFWLALTATMTALFWLPYILDRSMRLGLAGALATPVMNAGPAESEWAQRAKRAHYNAVENLVVFTALITVAQLAGVSNHTTAFAAALYFWCRLGHFIAYTAGIPYLRTLIWTASWVAEMIIAWQVLAH
jgi:uncharacterized MAPEG superfamily protein